VHADSFLNPFEDNFNTKQETPLILRGNTYDAATSWNVMTAFHPTAAPYFYAEGFGLPFPKNLNIANTSAARTTALGYAYYRSLPVVAPGVEATLTQVSCKWRHRQHTGNGSIKQVAEVQIGRRTDTLEVLLGRLRHLL